MINEDIHNVLRKLADILNSNNVNWMLIGSCNLAVQGMDFTPRDIDICVDLKDFDSIKALFSNFDKFETGQFPSKFWGNAFRITCFIDDVEIEFIGEGTQSLYTEAIIKKDFIKKGKLYLNKLENEYQAYLKMNRLEKAAKIKEYINNLISA